MANINWNEAKLLAEMEFANLDNNVSLMLLQIGEKYHILRVTEANGFLYPEVEAGCFARAGATDGDMMNLDIDEISAGTTDEEEAWTRWGNYLTWWSIKYARDEQTQRTQIVRMSDEYKSKPLRVNEPQQIPGGFEHYLLALKHNSPNESDWDKTLSMSKWRDPMETMQIYTQNITHEDKERYRAYLDNLEDLDD